MNESVLKEIIATIGTIIVAIVTGWFSYKTAKKSKGRISLKKHSFFTRIEILQGEVTRNFNLKNKGKEIVFKEVIVTQLSIFNEILKNFAQDIEDGKITDSSELYNRAIVDFENIYQNLHVFYENSNMYSEEDKRVISIVMNKYEDWNEDIIGHCKENLLMICNSPFYSDVPTKGAVILDSYMSITVDTINYAEKTLNHINGDLRGLVFKGQVI